MQGIILGKQSLSLPIASANQSSEVQFTARAKITCSQLELHVAPLTAKFSSFRMTVMNLAGSRVSEDLDFDPEALDH